MARTSKWFVGSSSASTSQSPMSSRARSTRRRCPPALQLFERTLQVDPVARAHNLRRLRALARERVGEVRVFSAHDPTELAWARAAS